MSRTLVEIINCDRCGLKEATSERVVGTPTDLRRIDISDECFNISSAPELFSIGLRVGVPISTSGGRPSKPATGKRVPCKYCEHTSPNRAALASHVRTQHHDILPYECESEECEERYDSESGRQRHYTRSGHGPKRESPNVEEHS